MKSVTEQKMYRKPITVRIKVEWAKNKFLYLLTIPVVLYYLLFHYLPMFGILIAFKQYSVTAGVFASPWVGFKYFKEFFEGIYMKRVLINTLIINFYSLIFEFPAPIIFAILLNEIRAKHFKKIIQTTTYLPHFISMVVICGMIVAFFNTEGVITQLMVKLGGERISYIANKDTFRFIFVATNIWQGVGWGSIVYIAALTSIDKQLYEAAVIHGAGRFKQMMYITLPGLLPTIMVMLILRFGQIVGVSYEKIILLYSPATYEVADVISSYVYRMGITESRYGYSAAVGLLQSGINVVFLVISNFCSKRFFDTSLF